MSIAAKTGIKLSLGDLDSYAPRIAESTKLNLKLFSMIFDSKIDAASPWPAIILRGLDNVIMTAEKTPLRNATGAAQGGSDEIAIWLDPPRFWSATQNMSEDEVGRLLNEVMILAEKRDLSALRQYDFISLYRRPIPAED